MLRVVYDNRKLDGYGTARLRQEDALYETTGGDPQRFTFEKDGLFNLRVMPAAAGDAPYNEVAGDLKGSLSSTTETGRTVVFKNATGRGILRSRTDGFPSGGPWGTPVRRHPDDANIKVEVYRLGRPLTRAPFEIPDAFVKYIVYYAMAQCLKREGPGQDLKLANHFQMRYELGVAQIIEMKRKNQSEKVTAMGSISATAGQSFGLGHPTLPSEYPTPRY